MILGLESLAADPPAELRGARLGLLMNRASVDRDLRLACDVVDQALPGQLTALFSPQHGWLADRQANMIESPHARHSRLDIPIYSLYSETRRPTPEMLAEVDCLLVDLQDAGTRVYTFVWTVLACLEACAESGVRVIVLDRPNPTGGQQVEGPLLELDYRSFVGGARLPMRHGLTMGELALLLRQELALNVDLEVVPLRGWRRRDLFGDLGRAWVPPSPNLPRHESALLYPGQVLLEGTNLSEGRGTSVPFEMAGAPFIDPDALCQALQKLDLPGVRFLPAVFTPAFDKWQGESCGGVSLHVVDAERFRPYRTAVAMLAVIRSRWPREFAWRPPPYEYERHKMPIDIISGSSRLRIALDSMDEVDLRLIEGLSQVDAAEWGQRSGAVRLLGA